jgi:exosome complex component RRP41
MDGHLTREEFEKALDMAINGCYKISELQKKALIDKYQKLTEVD